MVSMCVSQPALWKQIIEDWQVSRTPLRPQINICENDVCGKCMCPRCLSWDALDPNSALPVGCTHLDFENRVELTKKAWLKGDREAAIYLGSLSDRYARFYLAVQEEASKIDPNVVVCAYAYANRSSAPIKTKLNDRVYVGVVPPVLFPWTDKKRADFRAQWDGWAKAGARLFLRPNYTIDGHNMPIFYARKFGQDFSYAAKRGMIATDFDSITGQWGTQGPNLYVVGRMNVHPDWPVDKVLDEYYAGFGPAESAVRAYFCHWERVSDSVTDEFYTKINGGWDHFYLMAGRIFTPKVMAEGNALLKRASVAAKGNAVAEQRIAFLEKGLRNAELTLATQSAYEKYINDGNTKAFVRAFRELLEYRKYIEAENIANMGYLALFEDNKWDRLLLMLGMGERLDEGWKFNWDPRDDGLKNMWFGDNLDDSGWFDIGINSAWGKQEVGKKWEAAHGSQYDGIAWYRRSIVLKPLKSRHKIRLFFGAVDEAATIWINGKLVMQRPFPFEGDAGSWRQSFEVDVSNFVRFDRPNTLGACPSIPKFQIVTRVALRE